MARIVVELKDSLRDLFKAAVASEGLQMSEVLREFINSYSLHPRELDATVEEIAALVTALRNILAECTNPRAAYGKKVNEVCRAALAPFQEEGDE